VLNSIQNPALGQNPAISTGLEARFAAAARHSRMVRVLRVAVPAAVVLALAAIVAVSVFNPFRMLLPKLPIDIGNLVVSGTKITMESPHLAGFSTDQRPYELWAKAAVQDLTAPDHVELQTLRAKVMMEDKSTLTMDAHSGFFDSKQQLLDLREDIFLQSSTGYEAKLTRPISTSTRDRCHRTSMSMSNCSTERSAPTSSGSSTAAMWCASKATS
jgi:lipopolysaccharide export system protein LptC